MHGKFFWYDIMTTDAAAAARFYGDVVGWSTQASGQDDYQLFTTNGQAVAGLMSIPDEVQGSGRRPVWMGYIAVDDVDASTARIKELGGMIHRPPSDVPGVIRFAVVADPQGAVFLTAKGLMEDPRPPLPGNTPGTIGWRELYAGEWESAFAFYETMFGWTKSRAIDMGPMGTYQLFATGAEAVGGMMTKPPTIRAPFWGYYINVAALGVCMERIKAGGGSVVHGPSEVPGGSWIVQCIDPQGAFFALVAPTQ